MHVRTLRVVSVPVATMTDVGRAVDSHDVDNSHTVIMNSVLVEFWALLVQTMRISRT